MAPVRLRVSIATPDKADPSTRGLSGWLSRIAPASARGDVSVAIVSDRRMQALNRQFRGKNSATDVLSFPAEKPFLGDIVIAIGVAKRQAREHAHSVATEVRVLALHGLLHLLGYDHESPRDRGKMARVEARLRKQGGLKKYGGKQNTRW